MLGSGLRVISISAVVAILSISLPVMASEPGEATVRLTVRPMPAPRPALRYQLLPEVGELNAGNAAQWYLRCFAEQRNFFFSKQGMEERTKLLTLPLKEIPFDKNPNFGGNALRQADWAARLDAVDWQLIHRLQNDELEPSQPELSALHILALSLQARFRVELAAKKYDDAIITAKTLFAFARHLGENPTEAAGRLGLTVANLALDSLVEMVQQPGSPNLYWALAQLPCPLVDLRKGIQGSSLPVARQMKLIRDDTVMTDEELEKIVSTLSGMLGFTREQAGKPPHSLRGVLAARARDRDFMRALVKRLIDAGLAEGLVPNFPPLQVLLVDAKRDYEIRRDERMKLLGLSPWQMDAVLESQPSAIPTGLFDDFLPPLIALRHLQGQFEQRVALLQVVEALRLFAAEHAGRLPARLEDLTVPAPHNPCTGKAFTYGVAGNVATVSCSPPRGEERHTVHGISWTVTIEK